MPLSFPPSPSPGDTYTFNGKTWVWNGEGWQLQAGASINGLPVGNINPSTGAFTTLSSVANTSLGPINSNLTPAANSVYSLGSASNQWANLYLAGNTIYLGDVTISATAGNLVLPDVVQIGTTTLDASSGNLALPENISATTLTLSGAASITGNVTGGNINPTGNITLTTSKGVIFADGSLAQTANTFMMIAASDETTSLTTGNAKVTFRAPFPMFLPQIPRASLTNASSSGNVVVDINANGNSIFSTPITVNAGAKTSVTANVAAVLSTTTIADDQQITIDIDSAGTSATGLKVTLYYRRQAL